MGPVLNGGSSGMQRHFWNVGVVLEYGGSSGTEHVTEYQDSQTLPLTMQWTTSGADRE